MVNKPAYMVYLGITKLYLGYQNPKGYQQQCSAQFLKPGASRRCGEHKGLRRTGDAVQLECLPSMYEAFFGFHDQH